MMEKDLDVLINHLNCLLENNYYMNEKDAILKEISLLKNGKISSKKRKQLIEKFKDLIKGENKYNNLINDLKFYLTEYSECYDNNTRNYGFKLIDYLSDDNMDELEKEAYSIEAQYVISMALGYHLMDKTKVAYQNIGYLLDEETKESIKKTYKEVFDTYNNKDASDEEKDLCCKHLSDKLQLCQNSFSSNIYIKNDFFDKYNIETLTLDDIINISLIELMNYYLSQYPECYSDNSHNYCPKLINYLSNCGPNSDFLETFANREESKCAIGMAQGYHLMDITEFVIENASDLISKDKKEKLIKAYNDVLNIYENPNAFYITQNKLCYILKKELDDCKQWFDFDMFPKNKHHAK